MLLTGKKGLGALLALYGVQRVRLPEVAGCYAGRGLIICGDAACVWDDLERFGCRSDRGRGGVAKDGWDFLAVNKMVETFPGVIEHCYSNAAHLLPVFKASRRQEYAKEFPSKLQTHSCQDGATWRWPWPGTGSSSLGGTLTGLALGYTPIVLCGIPLDDGPHNGEPPWRRTKFASSEVADGHDWLQARDVAFQGRVKSMSGRTREWLGAP